MTTPPIRPYVEAMCPYCRMRALVTYEPDATEEIIKYAEKQAMQKIQEHKRHRECPIHIQIV